MTTAVSHKSFSGILALALLAGCSLRDPKQAFQINVQMPKNASAVSVVSKAQATTATAATGTPATDPASVAAALGYSCFALNIVGAGIAADPRFGCSDPTMGQMVGMAGLNGGALSAEVLAGPARKIQLIGVKFEPGTSIQNCATFESLLSSGASFDGIDPYYLGEVTTDIFSNVSVSITASFTSPPKMFDQCGDNSKDGGALRIGFNSNGPMSNLGQTLSSGTATPGTFQANGGKPPYSWSFGLTNPPEGSNTGSIAVSADGRSAVYSIFPGMSSWSSLVSVSMKVTDSAGASAFLSIPVGGPAYTTGIILPFSAPLGACVPVQVMATDSFGVPTLAASTMGPMTGLSLGSNRSGSYFFYAPDCTSPNQMGPSVSGVGFTSGAILGNFTFGANIYSTVYFKTPSSVYTSATLTLSGSNTNSTATVSLTGPVQAYAFQNYNSPQHMPTAIARGVCLSAPVQLMLVDSTGAATGDSTTRSVQLSGADANTQFYSDVDCTDVQSKFTLNPYQVSTGQLYLKTTSTSATATWTVTGSPLPSSSFSMTVYDPSLPVAPDDVRLNNQADNSLQVHGTFLATDSIRMFLDVTCTGTPIDTQTVGASGFNAGYFKFTLPTGYTGPHNYYVQDVNAAGTTSVCSGPFSINAW